MFCSKASKQRILSPLPKWNGIFQAEARILELALLLLAVGVDRLEQTQTRALDGLDVFVLLVAALLVLLLEALHEGLEVGLELLDLCLLLLDHLLSLGSVQSHVLIDQLLLCVVAKVLVSWPALWAEALGELGELVEVAAALVVLQVVRISVLESGESLDAYLVALALATGGAVHIGDQDVLGAGVLRHQLVPVGLHLLAVSAPRREELDKHGLAARGISPCLLRELRGSGNANEEERGELHPAG